MKRICKIRLVAILVALLISGIIWNLQALTPSAHGLKTIKNREVIAPEIDGSITISGKSTIEVALQEGNVVSLFKDFKMGAYPIIFSFKGNDLKEDDQGRGVALFRFETQLYENRKLLGTIKRKPMPFFPGEMLEPVETFDIINLLTYAQGDATKKEFPGKLDAGEYTIVIRVIPVGVQGKIQEAKMIVRI